MLGHTLVLLASAALAVASPTYYEKGSGCSTNVPTLPVNGGAKELPAPAKGLKLKHIALGFGIQNYTCADAGATPAAIGALAMLYDITDLYTKKGANQQQLNELPAKALNTHKVPLNLLADGPGADPKKPFTAPVSLKLDGVRPLPYLGQHFFTDKGVPAFVLKGGKEVIYAKKLDDTPAPATADKGPDGTGAVAWLYLGDAGGSKGLQYVYRVVTAGGVSHGCKAKGADSTSYATEYWFYG